ncbi:MAG: IS3 family transposase, partial [Wolbachia sp.]|nr:IS3 family transposase [Wolbachia sp.]MDD9335776.1 IS3 family transposase [Wolbachia sp.]
RTLKQEAIYYYRPGSIRGLDVVIKDFINLYNYRRQHKTMHYKVPADLYCNR